MTESANDVEPLAVLAPAGWEAVGAPDRVAGGWDTLLWRFETADGRVHALRLHRPRANPEALAALHMNEMVAMRAARDGGLPVPAIEFHGQHDGRPFSIMEWMPGRTMQGALAAQPWTGWRVAHEFGRMQARLHRLCPKGVREMTLADWEAQAQHAGLAAAAHRLARPIALAHLDYHPRNVLAEGGRITAIVDFTNARITDRWFDVARTRVALRYAPLPREPLTPLINQLRKLVAAGWKRGYRAEAGEFKRSRVFEAVALARYLKDVRLAVAEGRGWATAADVNALEREFERALEVAGFESR